MVHVNVAITVRQGSTTFEMEFVVPYNCRSYHAEKSLSTYCEKTIVAWNM